MSKVEGFFGFGTRCGPFAGDIRASLFWACFFKLAICLFCTDRCQIFFLSSSVSGSFCSTDGSAKGRVSFGFFSCCHAASGG